MDSKSEVEEALDPSQAQFLFPFYFSLTVHNGPGRGRCKQRKWNISGKKTLNLDPPLSSSSFSSSSFQFPPEALLPSLLLPPFLSLPSPALSSNHLGHLSLQEEEEEGGKREERGRWSVKGGENRDRRGTDERKPSCSTSLSLKFTWGNYSNLFSSLSFLLCRRVSLACGAFSSLYVSSSFLFFSFFFVLLFLSGPVRRRPREVGAKGGIFVLFQGEMGGRRRKRREKSMRHHQVRNSPTFCNIAASAWVFL